jgi:hypothetical protein
METDLFTVTIKGISIEDFEDIVLSVTVSYKNEDFTREVPVKVPIFMSNGKVILETAAFEAFWAMRKHWNRLNPDSRTPSEGLIDNPDTSG